MRSFLSCLIALSMSATAVADRPILLVTPNGVWKSDVTANGPGPWVPQEIDVIVHGFGPGNGDVPDPPDVPVPPTEDPEILKVAELSKNILKDKSEATACAALIASLAKSGMQEDRLKQAIELSAPILDVQLKAEGRITKWGEAVVKITVNSKEIGDGLVKAWGVDLSDIKTITAEAIKDPDEGVSEAGIDWMTLIQVIQMIIELLKSLGVI